MTPQFPAGHGFTAIIVAFLGRLHPIGIVLAGLFQAMLLFFLLATDVLVRYRIRIGDPSARGASA